MRYLASFFALAVTLGAQPVQQDNLTSNQVQGQTGGRAFNFLPVNPAPDNPTGLTATAVQDQIDLDWSDNTDSDLAGYVVYRSVDNITFHPHTNGFNAAAPVVTDQPLQASAFNDTSTVADTVYYYRVLAVDASGKKSGFSAVVSATGITAPGGSADTTAPDAPVVLSISAGDQTVNLSWNANAATDLDYYTVYYDTTAGITTADSSVDLSGTSHVLTGLTNGTTYYFAISATDLTGNESDLSDEVSSEPVAPPADNYVLLDGTGDYLSQPDDSTNSPTGDFTWIAKIYLDNASSTVREGIITKEDATYDNFRFFKFHQSPFTRLSFLNSEPGAGNNSFNNQWTSDAFSPGNGAWFWVKLEFDSDVGGGNQEAYLYWKQNEEDSWIDVSGSDGPQAGTGSDDFAAPLEIGRVESTGETLSGRVQYAAQWTGITESGDPDWEFNANLMSDGETTLTDPYNAETWTLTGDAVLVDNGGFVPSTGGVAYSYYRFEAAQPNFNGGSDYRWAIWNIAGYEANDNTGTDLFSTDQASVSASSAPNEDQNAFNGNASNGASYWDSFPRSAPAWIQVRLNTAAVIRSIDYQSRFDSVFGWTAQSMNIYGSNNGTDFTLLDTVNLSDVNTEQQFTDIQAASGGSGPGSGGGDGGEGNPLPGNYDISIVEIGWRNIAMTWSDIGGDWDDPVIVQRSTSDSFTAPTDLTNNQSTSTFRFVGLGATNYNDIEDLSEGTTYYYRVAKVTNLKAHYDSGATPTFSSWKYGAATTATLPSSKKQTYNVVTGYSADDTGATNCYAQVLNAFNAAKAAGGGIVYFPTGTYKIYPNHPDITDVGGIPTADPGDSYSNVLFNLTSDNITFQGDGPANSIINLRLWNDNPPTEWLQIRNASGTVTGIKRYFMFLTSNISDFTLKDIRINGGATPVTKSKSWYSLEDFKYQWDPSHKLIAGFDLLRGKNIVVDNVITNDWRGEVFYTGGIHGKYFIKDTTITRTNSSSVSMSADGEYVNLTIKDSANSAVESATFGGVIDFRTGRTFNQNTIGRGCYFDCYDQAGSMVGLPGTTDVTQGFGFNGWLVFNQAGTYQTLTDTTIEDSGQSGYAPWSETRNALFFNWVANNSQTVNNTAFIDWRPAPKGDYNLDGGLTNNLVLGGTFNVSKSYSSGKPIMLNYSAGQEEINRVVSSINFVNNSGADRTIDSLFLDRNNPGSRAGFLFQDFTVSGSNSVTVSRLYNGGSGIEPTYDNVFP